MNGKSRALVVVLALGLGGVFYGFVRSGRAAQETLTITGRGDTRRDAVKSESPPAEKPAASPPATAASPETPKSELVNLPPAPAKDVVVHVAGAVNRPGVYHLPLEARADDALRASGGAKPTANLDAINLAAHLTDGQQLYIPTRKEQPEGGAPTETPVKPLPRGPKSPAAPGTTVKAGSAGKSGGKSAKLSAPGQGTVNLNTAGAEELQRLPGVGPAMSARILEYRKENGSFQRVEQLMDISGIGEKKYEKMRPFVRLK